MGTFQNVTLPTQGTSRVRSCELVIVHAPSPITSTHSQLVAKCSFDLIEVKPGNTFNVLKSEARGEFKEDVMCCRLFYLLHLLSSSLTY
jgi:hypothetical protein